jgi:trehalose 6-phosphate phosphatase
MALFLDVDGTLVEIAPTPDRVTTPHHLPQLLARRSGKLGGALALVSGRPLTQLDRLFHPWRGAAAGLHGVERRSADGRIERGGDNPEVRHALAEVRPALAALAQPESGLLVEDEGANLTLHYRGAPERAAEILALAHALLRGREEALRLIRGKMVVEFQPRGVDKGSAIAAFLVEPPFRGRRPVFIGDDVTDEDGFAEIVRRGGIAIRVGPMAETLATHALPSVAAVHEWLATAA